LILIVYDFCDLGTTICHCTWYVSSMRHFIASKPVLLIIFVTGKLHQTWTNDSQMQHVKRSIR